MSLGALDIVIFVGYFLAVVIFAVGVAARSKTKSSADYFIASRKLPWYVVGASFIASNISTEHFIGMVGWGFLYGMAVASWEWGNVVTFSALIWIFLPFYMRGNVATMPEFLERRYNKSCRYIYATVMIVGLTIAMLGGVLFAGAKTINVFFPELPVWVGVCVLAAAAGTYTIYGGLLSAVWADLLQYILLMVGGTVVTIYGLYYAGGFGELLRAVPEKFIVFYPSTHEMIPWTGIVFGCFSVGLWYSCANQFMIQRCLGARSEWDARMGIVMAGFSKALLPLLVVVPGIIAFYLFQDRISDGDQAWPFMVSQFLPTGLVGLVLAGLASAILSTVSSITNSSATMFTLDLYKTLVRPQASDSELHLVGRLSAVAVLATGVLIGLVFATFRTVTVFQLIQTVFFYMAPPIAALFLVGMIWRGATPLAATWTMVLGFVVLLPAAVFVIFPMVAFLKPYDNFMHHTLGVFLMSCVLLIVLSLFTRPKDKESLRGVVWSRSALDVAGSPRGGRHGRTSLVVSWGVMVLLIVGLYAYTAYHSSGTHTYEAEDLDHAVSAGASARVQGRKELAETDRFNLWTGNGQVLVELSGADGRLDLVLPVEKDGSYQVDALVTVGPDYGAFSAEVNGKQAIITFAVTHTAFEGKKCRVRYESTELFDARKKDDSELTSTATVAGSHVVRRISLGTFLLEPEQARVSFLIRSADQSAVKFGLDQLIATYRGQSP